MKSIYTLAVIAALGLVSARAEDQPIGSPKYQEQHQRPLTGGKEVAQKFEFSRGKAASAPNTVVTTPAWASKRDLVREQRNIVYTGKNPLRDQQKQFEIAPAK